MTIRKADSSRQKQGATSKPTKQGKTKTKAKKSQSAPPKASAQETGSPKGNQSSFESAKQTNEKMLEGVGGNSAQNQTLAGVVDKLSQSNSSLSFASNEKPEAVVAPGINEGEDIHLQTEDKFSEQILDPIAGLGNGSASRQSLRIAEDGGLFNRTMERLWSQGVTFQYKDSLGNIHSNETAFLESGGLGRPFSEPDYLTKPLAKTWDETVRLLLKNGWQFIPGNGDNGFSANLTQSEGDENGNQSRTFKEGTFYFYPDGSLTNRTYTETDDLNRLDSYTDPSGKTVSGFPSPSYSPPKPWWPFW